MSRLPLLTPLLVMGVALWIHALHDFSPLDVYVPPSVVNASVEGQFSATYHEARALFRSRAVAAGATLHTLPLRHLAHLDLSIDVAVIDGAGDRALVHISGTHGVEGFAGSAIQAEILTRADQWRQRPGAPTVVLVHALNPYGFSLLRRFNEHNIDLNRNWLSPEDFERVQAKEPRAYTEVYDLLNPTVAALGSWHQSFWPRAIYGLATRGFGAIKAASVAGNYHYPQSIFYGGRELEPSLQLLEGFLHEALDFSRLRSLAVVDVHTGLGRPGEDTIILTHACNVTEGRRLFAEEQAAGRVSSFQSKDDDDGNAVTQGYSDAAGFVPDGIARLLPRGFDGRVLTLAQEFGTVPGVFVMKALSAENAFYHQAPARRLAYGERLRDVFYLHRSVSWKHGVLVRGREVFDKLHAALSSTAP